MLDLGFVVLLTAWSAGVGLRVLNRLGPSPEHPADALALAVPLGLGLVSLAVLGLGEFGALDRSGLLWVAAFGAWFGCRQGWLPWVGGARSSCVGAEDRSTTTWPHSPKPSIIIGATLALTVLGTLLTALAPVTDGDALCYHLQVPKRFLARGAAVFDPDLHETVYPLLTELLYAVALEFRGPVACRLAQWVRHGLGVVFGRETPEDYLARREPTFRVASWVAEHVPRDARLVGQDHRGFYFPRDSTMELANRRRTGLGRHGESAEAVVERLRSEGFTHVLLCPPVPETAVVFDPTLGRLLSSWLAERTPWYREDLTDADGVVRRYAIYRLSEPPIRAQAKGRMRQ